MDAKSSIWRYCNYQERSHNEVRSKLYELGCKTSEVEALMAELIEAGLLNEERYAKAIVRGKFRMKHWGRNKIIQQLKSQQISGYCIQQALKEIDAAEYYTALQNLALKKWKELRTEANPQVKKAKLYRYLLQKGFENDLIYDVFKEITSVRE